MQGILNISKPREMTSHDVVAITRRAAAMKKVGHTGTLDPMATGVLPVCIGSATRIMEYLDSDIKVYRCSMRLGLETDTDDIWGKPLEGKGDPEKAAGLTDGEITSAVRRYEGLIEQIPPRYSALKVDGKKLYEYARSGRDVEIKARKVFVESISEPEITRGKYTEAAFTVTCSKGTYIRSLCRDMGRDLGCGAVMSSLVRERSGIFRMEEAVDIEKIRKMSPEEIEKLLVPVDLALSHFGKGTIREGRVEAFLNGLSVYEKDVDIEKRPAYEKAAPEFDIGKKYPFAYCLYGHVEKGRQNAAEQTKGGGPVFLGVAVYDKETDSFRPDKVFFQNR